MNSAPHPTVLVLASTYPRWVGDHEPGFIHELCRRLAKRFRVIALVPDAPNADPNGLHDDVEVIRYHYAPRSLQTLVYGGGITNNLKSAPWKWLLVPGFVIGQYFAMRKILRRESISIVHAHWLLPQGLVARHLCGKHRIPFVVTSHGGDLFGLRGRLLNVLKQRVAASSAAMTVVSRAMAEEASALGISAPSISVIPMGVDFKDLFYPDPSVQRSSRELLFVGRLVEKKGIQHLLKSLPQLLLEFPDVRLTIAGFGPDEARLKKLTKELNIEHLVTFLGAVKQSHLPALYRRAALFVAPFIRARSGDQEGLPVALMEAVACGCPVVAGNVPGLSDLLGPAAQDVCLDPTNHHELTSRIALMLRNQELAEALANAIHERAANYVDWSRVANEYGDLLEQALAFQQGS